MKLTQQDMARLLNITPMTLRNWRKEKPKLYEIIMKGFAFEEVVKKAQQNADELKKLELQFKIEKRN
jgi:transcriptional regulator with XRE-family HTH domain